MTDNTITGTEANDIFYYWNFKAGNHSIFSGAGDDEIIMGSGNDTIYGGDGNDIIDGGRGQDAMYGGAGDDTFMANFSSGSGNVYNGGEGIDTLQIKGTDLDRSFHYINLDQGWDWMTNNTYLSIENIIGGWRGDYFIGSDADNRLEGHGGNDVLKGGAGDDSLYGGICHDRLYGGTGDDFLDGGSGRDWLEGGAGNDTFAADISSWTSDYYFGGDGVDTVQIADTNAEHSAFDVDLASRKDSHGNYYSSIENIIGGSNDDRFFGNDADNRLEGRDGDDVLEGRAGNDVLVGGNGADTYVFSGDFDDDTIVDWEDGVDQIQFGGDIIESDISISDSGDDTFITVAGEGTILLENVDHNLVTFDDFLFV